MTLSTYHTEEPIPSVSLCLSQYLPSQGLHFDLAFDGYVDRPVYIDRPVTRLCAYADRSSTQTSEPHKLSCTNATKERVVTKATLSAAMRAAPVL